MKYPFETISTEDLVTATGGMNLDGFRHSTHIQDRRTPEQIQADTTWMSHVEHGTPLPHLPQPAGPSTAKRQLKARCL
jgi:hypothetical protein